MATAPAWAEGTEYNGQAETDDYDFCTVGEVTYMCQVSHVATPDTHPSRGPDGRKMWAQAARAGLNGLNEATRYLKTTLGYIETARERLEPASLNGADRERFDHLVGCLHTRAQTLVSELERLTADHPK